VSHCSSKNVEQKLKFTRVFVFFSIGEGVALDFYMKVIIIKICFVEIAQYNSKD